MTSMNETVEELRERVRLLTMERESAKRVLEAAVESLSPSVLVDESFTREELFLQTSQRLRSFIRFDSLVFFLFSQDGLDLSPVYCDPPEKLSFFEEEMTPLVDDGTFAWAVDRNKPVVITARPSADDHGERRLLLHSIMTPNGSAGMFMGLLGEDETGILDVSFAFITVLLNTAAGILQNAEFNRTIRTLNEELQAKIDSLEVSERSLAEAIKTKELFLANVSHEVRTPLNGVMGLTAILESTSLDSRQRELLGVLKDESKTLLSMINDLLDFSKMDAKRLELEVAPFDIHELWSSVRESFASRAAAKGLAFTMSLEPSVPPCLSGDSLRVRQLLGNLIGNAVKFTPKGSVRVTGGGTLGEDGRFLLEVSIKDTGIGISDKDRHQLFEPFVQGDVSLTRRFGGTGLGLAISSRISEAMGGSISFESQEGAGTLFTVSLPLEIASPSPEADDADARTSERELLLRPGTSALVVEDNQTNRMVAVSLLNLQGVDMVDTAVDGVEAIEKLSSERYDIILMDIQMPRMDGLKAVSIIRDPRSPVMDHEAVVVAMTANVLPGEKERLIGAGMSDYIAKPIQPDDLRIVLKRFLSEAEQEKMVAAEESGVSRPDHPEERPFRQEALLSRMGGDITISMRTVETFIGDFPGMLDRMKKAVESGEAEELRMLSHTLRGASVNVEALQIARLAEEGERTASEGDVERLRVLCQRLDDAFKRFVGDAGRLRNGA